MRILFICRDQWQVLRAGDSVQIACTRAKLQELGVEVDLTTTSRLEKSPARWGVYDWIHLFNLFPVEETTRQAEWAKDTRTPIALSTIFWDAEEFLTHASDFKGPGQDWWKSTQRLRKNLVEEASLLLPNSRAEAELLGRTFGNHLLSKCRVVPNGVDASLCGADPQAFRKIYGRSDPFVLCVARIARRKNQLSLIRAMRGSAIPLVFIGPVNDQRYFDECRRESAGHVRFMGEMAPDLVASAYSAARVHALPSWFDTPGLASLEAGLHGCRVVSTDRGPTREYFADMAWYCDPDSPESIRHAVYSAWRTNQAPPLRDRILASFTWEKAAEATLNAYKNAGVWPRLQEEGAGDFS